MHLNQSMLEGGLTQREIAARLDRLPPSAWHVRMRLIMGSATFFDAFNSVAIASVLPVLVVMWHLSSQQIGLLISAGFAGQAIGAIGFGRLAEQIGRVRVASISVAIFGSMSLACVAANDYNALLVCQFIQGIGLGGEVPVAATYINEIANSRRRGRFFLLYECVFILGMVASSLVGAYVVPHFGYRWLFALGGLPALLVGFMRKWCPESPRWLASRGRFEEANKSLVRIEKSVSRSGPLPPYTVSAGTETNNKTDWRELFSGLYLQRTLVVWVLWFCSFFVSYGLTVWLPTIYRANYGVSIELALILGVVGNVFVLFGAIFCALVIDKVGRRLWMTVAFVMAVLPLITLALIHDRGLFTVVALTSAASAAINTIAITLYLYTPEVYPTRMRALGTSWATFWPRAATISGAYLVGMILPVGGLTGVFWLFGSVATAGALACGLWAVETREQVLEQISP